MYLKNFVSRIYELLHSIKDRQRNFKKQTKDLNRQFTKEGRQMATIHKKMTNIFGHQGNIN